MRRKKLFTTEHREGQKRSYGRFAGKAKKNLRLFSVPVQPKRKTLGTPPGFDVFTEIKLVDIVTLFREAGLEIIGAVIHFDVLSTYNGVTAKVHSVFTINGDEVGNEVGKCLFTIVIESVGMVEGGFVIEGTKAGIEMIEFGLY